MNQILKRALLVAAVPGLAASYVVFHPGVAYSQTPVATQVKPAAFALPGTFKIDPMHTSIGFEVGHMGLSKVQGRFDKMAGSIAIDPQDLAKSGVKITIETASIDTNVEPRDADLRSANFFDTDQFPIMKFESTSITKKFDGYLVEGNLTIKDVTKKVSIPFRAYGPIPDMMPGSMRVGFVADPIVINRQDYNIAYDNRLPGGSPAVSNEVTIRLSVEATESTK